VPICSREAAEKRSPCCRLLNSIQAGWIKIPNMIAIPRTPHKGFMSVLSDFYVNKFKISVTLRAVTTDPREKKLSFLIRFNIEPKKLGKPCSPQLNSTQRKKHADT
jgi:hypothetical protein